MWDRVVLVASEERSWSRVFPVRSETLVPGGQWVKTVTLMGLSYFWGFGPSDSLQRTLAWG